MRRAEMKQKKKKERLPRSDGLDDWSFLDHVKQTQYYRVSISNYQLAEYMYNTHPRIDM
jgi:hypothetical protein